MAKKSNPRKNKHLTLEERKVIEDCLGKRMTFKAISQLVQKDPTTISYEIKHHRQEHRNSFTYDHEPCPLLLKAPFVCNGCSKRHCSSCHSPHFLYRASLAHSEYRTLLSDAREGIPLNKEDFYKTDRIISNALRRGQHLYHIMANSPEIACSKSTVYRHFKKGYYSASRIDLPRAVKFKPRRVRQPDYVPAGIRLGRSYDDFLDYCSLHGLERHVELDTVVGRIAGKVIMTVHFTSCNFMAGILLDNKTAAQGAEHFRSLKDRLRNAGLSVPAIMDALLCDNGGEFAGAFSFENDQDGKREIPLFYCDPMSASQKPFIEKNHTLFRDIVPKGSSFDDFSQDTVDLIFSHVNSVSRSIYGGKTPFELFSFLYGDSVAHLFGITRIPPKQVVQSPLLLKGVADLSKNL